MSETQSTPENAYMAKAGINSMSQYHSPCMCSCIHVHEVLDISHDEAKKTQMDCLLVDEFNKKEASTDHHGNGMVVYCVSICC